MDPALQPELVPDEGQQIPSQELGNQEQQLEQSEQPDQGNQLAEAVAQGMAQFQATQAQQQPNFPGIGVQQPQQPQPPQLTPEEYAQAMNVAQFTPQNATDLHGALMADEFNPNQVVDWLNNLRDSLMAQAQRHVELQTQAMQMQLQNQFQPALEYTQNAHREKQQKAFFKDYPEAKAFEKILPTAAGTLQGQRFANKQEEHKALAGALETVIRSFGNSQFSLKKQTQQTQTQQTATPSLNGALPGIGGMSHQGAQTPNRSGAAAAIR